MLKHVNMFGYSKHSKALQVFHSHQLQTISYIESHYLSKKKETMSLKTTFLLDTANSILTNIQMSTLRYLHNLLLTAALFQHFTLSRFNSQSSNNVFKSLQCEHKTKILYLLSFSLSRLHVFQEGLLLQMTIFFSQH